MLRLVLLIMIATCAGTALAEGACVKYHPDSPIVSGTLNGVSVAVDLHADGTNGGANSSTAEWNTRGGNGELEQSLRTPFATNFLRM